ncbi:MAG: RNA polymerase sigma factor [Verrucomicrobia bacterium]|nr:RNA polymerase sigma factor [Verrucomicrobiota bacterium]
MAAGGILARRGPLRRRAAPPRRIQHRVQRALCGYHRGSGAVRAGGGDRGAGGPLRGGDDGSLPAGGGADGSGAGGALSRPRAAPHPRTHPSGGAERAAGALSSSDSTAGAQPSLAAGEEAAARDRELMALAQAGDEAALGALMERWERPVKTVIARLVGNAAEAEELAQEAFVRLWQRRDRFRAGAEFRPWMLSLALNLARNRLRWWRRRPLVALEEWTPLPPAETVDGAGALEARERAEAVRAAVAALPLEQREALVLFEYEGLAQAEIAVIADTTPKAVERRLERARAALRVSLQRWLRRG